MSTSTTEKKRVAGVEFSSTGTGKVDETELDPEEHTLGDHYLYGSGENKEDYSYVVVDADGVLRRGNVESAWSLGCRGQCPSRETHRRRLRDLGKEFDDNPIPEEDAKGLTTPDESGNFEKRVEIVEKDADEQIARGAVLVPDRLDHQGDFLRADTIGDLREAFDQRIEEGDAYPGVMHAVFPREDLELVEDRQLDTPETIGEKDLPAGTWLQGWKYADDRLWSLVDRGVLGGFSIGGTAKGVIHEPGTLPEDVEIPDAVQDELEEADLDREDIVAREITEGRIMETSTVDHPAVPDAVHADVKSLSKASPALTDNVVQARLYLESRGHDPDDAKVLAEYLNERKAATGESAESGLIARAKRWLGWAEGQIDDEAAESATGSDGTDFLETMDEDELNEKLDGLAEQQQSLDERLERIDAQLSEVADAGADDGGDGENGSGEEKTETENGSDGGDEPTTEEKVDRLAEKMVEMSEQNEKIAERVEQMANAQGVSQQADQGASNTESKEDKLWGENSPFAPATGGDA